MNRPLVALVIALAAGASCLAVAAPSYRMSLDIDPAEATFRGDLSVRYENQTLEAQTEVFFRLYGNAGAIYGSAAVEVLSVSVDGGNVETSVFADDTIVFVPLPDPLAPGASVEISLRFAGAAARTGSSGFASETEYGLLTRTADTLTLTAFYPLLAPITDEGWAIDPVAPLGDAIFADAADYEVTVLVPSGVTVIPSPDTAEEAPDGRRLCSFVRRGFRDFTLIVVDGERVPLSATASGVEIHAWFAPQHAEAASIALERSLAAVDLYSALFGPLPYPIVDVVETPLQRVAGVECSGLFLVSSWYAADPRNPFFDVIISHEMAHQWFFAAVGNDPAEEPWLDEALATFSSNVFLSAVVSEAAAEAERAGWRASYERAASARPELHITSPVYDFPDPGTYSAFVYSGGAFELDALRLALGDDVFFRGLADYYQSHLLSVADGADLLAHFRTACSCWFASPLWDELPALDP